MVQEVGQERLIYPCVGDGCFPPGLAKDRLHANRSRAGKATKTIAGLLPTPPLLTVPLPLQLPVHTGRKRMRNYMMCVPFFCLCLLVFAYMLCTPSVHGAKAL